MAEIIVNSPSGEGELVYELPHEPQFHVTIGRAAENSIVIEDASASRLHATIERFHKIYVIRDNGSTVGTMVNGKAVTESELCSGDSILFGSTLATFRLSEGEQSDRNLYNNEIEFGDKNEDVNISHPAMKPPDPVRENPHERHTGFNALQVSIALARKQIALLQSLMALRAADAKLGRMSISLGLEPRDCDKQIADAGSIGATLLRLRDGSKPPGASSFLASLKRATLYLWRNIQERILIERQRMIFQKLGAKVREQGLGEEALTSEIRTGRDLAKHTLSLSHEIRTHQNHLPLALRQPNLLAAGMILCASYLILNPTFEMLRNRSRTQEVIKQIDRQVAHVTQDIVRSTQEDIRRSQADLKKAETERIEAQSKIAGMYEQEIAELNAAHGKSMEKLNREIAKLEDDKSSLIRIKKMICDKYSVKIDSE